MQMAREEVKALVKITGQKLPNILRASQSRSRTARPEPGTEKGFDCDWLMTEASKHWSRISWPRPEEPACQRLRLAEAKSIPATKGEKNDTS